MRTNCISCFLRHVALSRNLTMRHDSSGEQMYWVFLDDGKPVG